MTIRRIFLLVIVPLFLLLAGVNGALLHLRERAEAIHGLQEQALAAAVTTAAFAAGSDDLAGLMADPLRVAAIREAAAHVSDLEGLYVAAPDGSLTTVAGAAADDRSAGLVAPTAPVALPIRRDTAGRHVAIALAPAAPGHFVIARIDAEPLMSRVAALKRLIAALVAGAGLVGLALALAVARRIVRELARNSAMIEAIRSGAPPDGIDGLAIRETRDLADAVRLMGSSVSGRLLRGERERVLRDRLRDEAASVTAYRQTVFPPLSAAAAGMQVAVRMLGAAPAGSFFALCEGPGRAALVLGECAGDTPASALALALAAREFFERRMFCGALADCVDLGVTAFGLRRVVWREWAADTAPRATLRILTLLDADERAAAYASRSVGLQPDALLNDLATLLNAHGVIAALRGASLES
jgi:hypothetical protein